ncbi:MAG: HNH endonuclease, partial [Gordonia sp.]
MTSSAPALAQMADDERHCATELVEVLHHCNAVRAAADYRMLQAVSLIHDEREQDHLVRLAAALGEQSTSLATLERLAKRAAAGEDPRAQYGPTGLEMAIAEVGAALTVPPARARELIEAGSVLRHQLPFTGATLVAGRIDLPRFLVVVRRTVLADPAKFAVLDTEIAAAIESREPMSMTRFTTMIDKIIAKIDPAAVRRRREQVDTDRNISVRPDRHTPGQSRIGGVLPAEQAAAIDARLQAMAASVHPDDPRTAAQRRADALVALADGAARLDCRCEVCTTTAGADDDSAAGEERDGPDASPDTGSDATGTDASDVTASDTNVNGAAEVRDKQGEAVTDAENGAGAETVTSDCAPRPTFHIVVNLSTLLGHDDDPAFLDGHGVIDADTARALLAEAKRCYVT